MPHVRASTRYGITCYLFGSLGNTDCYAQRDACGHSTEDDATGALRRGGAGEQVNVCIGNVKLNMRF